MSVIEPFLANTPTPHSLGISENQNFFLLSLQGYNGNIGHKSYTHMHANIIHIPIHIHVYIQSNN